MNRLFLTILTIPGICGLLLTGAVSARAQAPQTTPSSQSSPLIAPGGLKAFDIPSDRGDAVGLSWDALTSESRQCFYVVSQSSSPDGDFKEVARFRADTKYQSDEPKFFGYSNKNKNRHFISVDAVTTLTATAKSDKDKEVVQQYYKVGLTNGTTTADSPDIVTAMPVANWFCWYKTNNLILTALCCGFVLFFIQWATRNPNLFIRKLAGLEAIDEAIGRCTEMGKPILYSTGYNDMDYVSTIASVNILSHVAKKVADYDSRLLVPCKWSITMTVCQEVVKEAYVNAGRPDAYNPHDVYYIAGEQFSYTAAVDGLIVREKPAANFLLGTFAAEALILAETGASTGAIQISGTDSAYQIPFFVVACDYCLIGEELYVASAYLSREPRLLGSLKGQDAGKLLLIAALVIGNILILLNQFTPSEMFLWIKQFFTPL